MKQVELVQFVLDWAAKKCDTLEAMGGPEGSWEEHTYSEGCNSCAMEIAHARPEDVLREIKEKV